MQNNEQDIPQPHFPRQKNYLHKMFDAQCMKTLLRDSCQQNGEQHLYCYLGNDKYVNFPLAGNFGCFFFSNAICICPLAVLYATLHRRTQKEGHRFFIMLPLQATELQAIIEQMW